MQTWSFLPSENRLQTGNEVTTLTSKAALVLSYLMQNEARVVSRDEILKAVWGDVHVTPDLVREYIFDLRQALGDDAANPRYIETVRGKGFRLLGGVEVQRQVAPGTSGLRRVRIAVLRPDCLEGGALWQRFADGMADELITDLARFSDIAVLARASTFAVNKARQALAIRDHLECDYLVDCSLSAWPEQLTVRFQLIDGRDGTHAWADTLERPIGSMPKMSGEIALTVANQLGGMSGEIVRAERRYAQRRPLTEMTAYEHYVMACYCEESFDPASIETGLNHAESLVALDPGFARGHLVRSYLCGRHVPSSQLATREAWLEQMAVSAENALKLDPRDPLILAGCAHAFATRGRIAEAQNAVVRAADFAANDSLAAINTASTLTLVSGAYDVAEELLQVAFDLCPDPPSFYAFAHGRNLLFSGRYEEAEQAAQSGPDFESTYVIKCLAQSLQGKRADARQTYDQLLAKYPHFSLEKYPSGLGMVARETLETYHHAVAGLGTI